MKRKPRAKRDNYENNDNINKNKIMEEKNYGKSSWN